jgi:hypothetical protein
LTLWSCEFSAFYGIFAEAEDGSLRREEELNSECFCAFMERQIRKVDNSLFLTLAKHIPVGDSDGDSEGIGVGPGVGTGVGCGVGAGVGIGVGPGVGVGVGAGVGAGVGSGVKLDNAASCTNRDQNSSSSWKNFFSSSYSASPGAALKSNTKSVWIFIVFALDSSAKVGIVVAHCTVITR